MSSATYSYLPSGAASRLRHRPSLPAFHSSSEHETASDVVGVSASSLGGDGVGGDGESPISDWGRGYFDVSTPTSSPTVLASTTTPIPPSSFATYHQQVRATPKEPRASRNALHVNALVLDEDGFRCQASLVILKNIIDGLANTHGSRRPCDYFQIIAGTGFGGLLAILFVRLRLTIEEAITEFDTICSHVFDTNVFMTYLRRTSRQFNIDAPRLKTTLIEEHVEKLSLRHIGSSNPLLAELKSSCSGPTHVSDTEMNEGTPSSGSARSTHTMKTRRITTGAVSFAIIPIVQQAQRHELHHVSNRTTLLTTNPGASNPFPTMRLLDAVRLTCTIPGVFVPATYNGEVYTNGAIFHSNPSLFALSTFRSLYGSHSSSPHKLNLVNIGAGCLHVNLLPSNGKTGFRLKGDLGWIRHEKWSAMRETEWALKWSGKGKMWRFLVKEIDVRRVQWHEVFHKGKVVSALNVYLEREEVMTQLRECTEELEHALNRSGWEHLR